MADAEQAPERIEPWFVPTVWGRADPAAFFIWTAAIVLLFWDAVTLRGRAFLLRHHRDQLSLPRVLRRRAAGWPVLAVVPLALLRHAAL